jgi:hypothetical protein
MIMQPDPVLLYHITHLDNLPGILRTGCLHCHRQLHQAGQHPVTEVDGFVKTRERP